MSDAGVVVLGAGPAGLSVAERLSARAVPTTVVDGAPGVGGLGRSLELWGTKVDLGPHSFYSTGHPDSVARWLDLTGGRVERTAPRRGALWRGQVVPFPPKPVDVLRAVGPRASVRLGSAWWSARRRPAGPDPTSARDRWSGAYGAPLVEEIFAPYTRKYLGLEPEDVDADFAGLLLSSRTSRTDQVQLLTPTEGSGSVWLAAAERVRQSGGAVVLGQPVTELQCEDDRVVAVGLRDGTVLPAGRVVSTLPPHILLRCLPGVDPAAHEAAAALRARDTHLVYLRVMTDEVVPWHYLTVYDEAVQLGRVTNMGMWRPRFLGSGAGTIICAEFWSGDGDALGLLSDADLAALAIDELDAAGLVPRSVVSESHVHRLRKSVPVLSRGYRDRLGVLRSAFSKFEGLEIIGRHGTHQWDGQEDALVQGGQLADRLAGALTLTSRSDGGR